MKRRYSDCIEGEPHPDEERQDQKRAAGSAAEACEIWANALSQHAKEPVHFDRTTDRLIVPIIGSYNAGKSALVNRIISEDLLISAPVEQTAVPWCILQPDTSAPVTLQNRFPHIVFANAERLPFQNLVLVDTPGYGGVDPVDVCLEPLLSLSHAAILCISSQTPVTLSDIAILKQVRHFRHKLFIALTKADLCKGAIELDAVVSSVKARLSPVLHYSPEVYPVSSLLDTPYDFAQLTEKILSLDRDKALRRSLILRRALDVLSMRNEGVVAELEQRLQLHRASSLRFSELKTKIGQMCRDLISEIGACRHALRRQVHLLPSGSEGPALSAPLSGLRTQIDHAIISFSREYPDISQDDLALFRQETSKKLRQVEAVMETAGEPEEETSSQAYEKGLTATSAAGVMIATALNPVVGVGAAVAWFAASKYMNRKSSEDSAVQRKLLGIPLTVLDLIANDINRLETSLSAPILEKAVVDDAAAFSLQSKVEELERIGRSCRRDINAEINCPKRSE